MGAWLQAKLRALSQPSPRKLLQQVGGLHQVPPLLDVKLPFIFYMYGHCHDEGIWFPPPVKFVGPAWVKVI